MYTAYGKAKSSGFTIVELLIVVVVIAVLAAITIVAYNGIRLRATTAALTTELSSIGKQLGVARIESSAFPANLTSVKKSSTIYFEYTVDNGAATFCVTGTQNGTSYYVQQSGSPQPGRCAGHTGVASTVPTFQNLTVTQVTSTARDWREMAVSQDGTRIAATVESGYVHTSTNSGTTWTERTTSGVETTWQIAGSGDGMTLLVGSKDNSTLRRSADQGATWTFYSSSPGVCTWSDLVMSADGVNMVGSCMPNQTRTYTSNNSGATWNYGLHGYTPNLLVSSSSGDIVAGLSGSNGSRSSDYGQTWGSMSLPCAGTPVSMAMSANGQTIYAGCSSANIMRSTNSGTNWTAVATSGTRTWNHIATSADGTKLAAAVGTAGEIITSIDSGATWVVRTGFGATTIRDIVMSADGATIYVSTGGSFPTVSGHIYRAVFD